MGKIRGENCGKSPHDTIYILVSQATPFAERGSGHAATIELSSQQKLDVTNQICALRRLHPLSWSTITSQRVQRISEFYYLTAVFDNCVPR